jgi:hypothetical protein
MEFEGAIEPRRKGIDQQLGAIETVTGPGLKAAVRAQTVAGARAKICDMPVKHIAGLAGQLDSRGLGPGLTEERNKYRFGATRRDGEVHPPPIHGGTKRLGCACCDARIAHAIGRRHLTAAQVITFGAERPV